MILTPYMSFEGMFHSLGSVVLNTLNHGTPARLCQTISKNLYNIRRTGQIRRFDASKKRIDKQTIGNRIDHIVQALTGEWSTILNKHDVRKFLKKTFLWYRISIFIQHHSNNFISFYQRQLIYLNIWLFGIHTPVSPAYFFGVHF